MQELVFVNEGKPSQLLWKYPMNKSQCTLLSLFEPIMLLSNSHLHPSQQTPKGLMKDTSLKKNGEPVPSSFRKKKGNILQIGTPSPRLHRVTPCFKRYILFSRKIYPLQECTFRIGILFSCLWPQFPPSKVCKRTFQGAPEWHQASDGQAVVHQSRALPLPDSLSCHDSATGSPFLQLYYFEHRCWHF